MPFSQTWMGIRSETQGGRERTKFLNTLIRALTLGHEGTTGVYKLAGNMGQET